MASKTKNFHIWQWNCASFKQRRATLQQYLESQPEKPQVILLQETLCETLTIPGYRVVAAREQGKRGLATLVSTQVSFQEHVLKINSAKLEHIMIEIVPNVKWSARLFILNVYDSPSDYKQPFNTLISKAATLARDVPIVMAGDFNAAHEAWGYQTTKKGSTLL